mgnify:CR=1 FL=1
MRPLPPLQTGKSVWYGPAMNRRKKEWIIPLHPAEIVELEAAAEQFQQNGKSIGEMQKSDFSLPIFGKKLTALQDQLINGLGFGLLRGLSIEKYSEKEAATIFPGLHFMPIAIQRIGTQYTLIPRGDTVFKEGDHVYFMTIQGGVEELYKLTGKVRQESKNVMISGGSKIGFNLFID